MANAVPQQPLPGPLGQLAEKCFVEEPQQLAWAQAVANGTLCEDTVVADDVAPAELSAMLASALTQCGAWCLWDL
jgi:hypothetical protein